VTQKATPRLARKEDKPPLRNTAVNSMKRSEGWAETPVLPNSKKGPREPEKPAAKEVALNESENQAVSKEAAWFTNQI
jgi:hypothetical protein